MEIGKFIEEFDKAAAKDRAMKKVSETTRLIDKHIVRPYISYEVKMNEAKRIVDLSMYVDVDGKKVFSANTPLRYMLLMMAIIRSYTDLEFDITNTLIQFDLLESRGIFDIFVNEIGADFERFQTVLNMTVDDRIANERSLVGFFMDKAEALSVTATALLDQLDEMNKAEE